MRSDDIWSSDTILQNIFSLIYRAQVVIVDFTGKNPNVMYETGIAYTLNKDVVPITQSDDDIPSDIHHYKAFIYSPKEDEGYRKLQKSLETRLGIVLGV